MPDPNCPECHGTGFYTGSLLGGKEPCSLCSAKVEFKINESSTIQGCFIPEPETIIVSPGLLGYGFMARAYLVALQKAFDEQYPDIRIRKHEFEQYGIRIPIRRHMRVARVTADDPIMDHRLIAANMKPSQYAVGFMRKMKQNDFFHAAQRSADEFVRLLHRQEVNDEVFMIPVPDRLDAQWRRAEHGILQTMWWEEEYNPATKDKIQLVFQFYDRVS